MRESMINGRLVIGLHKGILKLIVWLNRTCVHNKEIIDNTL